MASREQGVSVVGEGGEGPSPSKWILSKQRDPNLGPGRAKHKTANDKKKASSCGICAGILQGEVNHTLITRQSRGRSSPKKGVMPEKRAHLANEKKTFYSWRVEGSCAKMCERGGRGLRRRNFLIDASGAGLLTQLLS